VVAVATAAPDRGGFRTHQQHNRVIGQPTALLAPVVDNIAETQVPHFTTSFLPSHEIQLDTSGVHALAGEGVQSLSHQRSRRPVVAALIRK
jgi:hypothetical protein